MQHASISSQVSVIQQISSPFNPTGTSCWVVWPCQTLLECNVRYQIKSNMDQTYTGRFLLVIFFKFHGLLLTFYNHPAYFNYALVILWKLHGYFNQNIFSCTFGLSTPGTEQI